MDTSSGERMSDAVNPRCFSIRYDKISCVVLFGRGEVLHLGTATFACWSPKCQKSRCCSTSVLSVVLYTSPLLLWSNVADRQHRTDRTGMISPGVFTRCRPGWPRIATLSPSSACFNPTDCCIVRVQPVPEARSAEECPGNRCRMFLSM